jgi:hypothetical protein
MIKNAPTLSAAMLGIFAGFGHSWLGETRILILLYREGGSRVLSSRRTRDTIRLVWHIPSMAWIVIGAFLLIHPEMEVLRWLAAIVYGLSGLANLCAIRRVHLGNVVLGAAAVLLLL